MRSLQAQPVELNIFRTAAILGIVAMFAGILLYEPLFFLVPIAFLFAYQLILNFKTIFYLLLIVTPASIEYYSPTGFSTTLPTEPIMLVFMLTFIFYVFLKQELFDRAFISHPLTIILFMHSCTHHFQVGNIFFTNSRQKIFCWYCIFFNVFHSSGTRNLVQLSVLM